MQREAVTVRIGNEAAKTWRCFHDFGNLYAVRLELFSHLGNVVYFKSCAKLRTRLYAKAFAFSHAESSRANLKLCPMITERIARLQPHYVAVEFVQELHAPTSQLGDKRNGIKP